MKKKSGPSVTLEADNLRVRVGDRQASFNAALDEETDVLVVDLDSTTHFDPPHEGQEIEVEMLQRLTVAIEAFADEEGIDLEFE